MKKLVILLVALAITVPALADNVDFLVTNTATGGEVEISYTAEATHGPRGIALLVTLVGCELADETDIEVADLSPAGSGLNTCIDHAYTQELTGTYAGPGVAGQHPIAVVPGPGKLETYPATSFAVSIGALDTTGSQAAAKTGASYVIVTLQLTDTNGATLSTIEIADDDDRGGSVVNDQVDPTVSGLDVYEVTFIVAPDCWNTTQCKGDADGDGDVDTADWPAFRDAFPSAYGDPEYNPCADFDRDGDIDTSDWPSFRDNFPGAVTPTCTPGGTWPPL